MSLNLGFVADLAERVAATYVQAFAGLLLADSTGLMSLGTVRVAAVAALPAALAVVKAALAGSVLSGGSASLLPAPAAAVAEDAPAEVVPAVAPPTMSA